MVIMMKTNISFALVVTLIPLSWSQQCTQLSDSGTTKDVCCADYEKKEGDCIDINYQELDACSIGYTSASGEKCKRCAKHTYGERCAMPCSCSEYEICDNVVGCVEYSPATGSSVYDTSVTFGYKSCTDKKDSGEIEKVCCADYEEKGEDCIACGKGYTSEMGQNCRPCMKNTYGEKCRYECDCVGLELCDNVKGCVEFPPTTEFLVYLTSFDRTIKWTTKTGSDSKNDITDLIKNLDMLDASTKQEKKEDELSRKIITYYTLTLLVVVPGICLCIFFYKSKIVTKKKTTPVIEHQNHAFLENIQNIEREESLYDNIDETDMLGCFNELDSSSCNLNVNGGSTSPGSHQSKHEDGSSCLSLQTTRSKGHDNKAQCSLLMSGENTSFSDKGHHETKQEYFNTTPKSSDNRTTSAILHRYNSSMLDINSGSINGNENILQHPLMLINKDLRRQYDYEVVATSIRDAVELHRLCNVIGLKSMSSDNLDIAHFGFMITSDTDRKHINFTKADICDCYDRSKTKSESDLFCKNVQKKKRFYLAK